MAGPDKRKRLVNEAFSKVEALVEQVRKEAADTCATIADQVEELHKQEAVTLHNRLGAVIEELKPAPDNTLLALELLKHEVVNMIVARMAERPQQQEEAPPKKE